jgi:hypothetical protein
MKNRKLLKYLGIICVAILTLVVSIFLSHPSNATNSQYKKMIALGLIDAVKTPHELGLDYLQQTPPILVAGLMDNIHKANGIVQNTSNISVKIPMPSADNATVPTGYRTPAGTLTRSTAGHSGGGNTIAPQANRYRALSSINRRNGLPERIRTPQLGTMFTAEARGNGDINRGVRANKNLPKDKSFLVADASGLFAQEQEINVFDLVLYDTWDGQTYLVPEVGANAFCRDSLNAVLEDTWELYEES